MQVTTMLRLHYARLIGKVPMDRERFWLIQQKKEEMSLFSGSDVFDKIRADIHSGEGERVLNLYLI